LFLKAGSGGKSPGSDQGRLVNADFGLYLVAG
jgi:hypothetical protein